MEFPIRVFGVNDTTPPTPTSISDDVSEEPTYRFYGRSLSTQVEGLEEGIIPRPDDEHHAGVNYSFIPDNLTTLTPQTLAESSHADIECARAWSSTCEGRILCTPTPEKPMQRKVTIQQEVARPVAAIDIYAAHPGHLIGIELESPNLKVLSNSDLHKGDILVKTKVAMNGYPLLSISVENYGSEAIIEIVTAPLSMQEHIKNKTENLIIIAKLALLLNIQKPYISLEEFAETFNRYLPSIYKEDDKEQYLMEIPSTALSLRDSDKKYDSTATRIMTRPGFTSITGILLSPVNQNEIKWYRQTNLSFNWVNIHRFDKLFPRSVVSNSHQTGFPMLISKAQKWIRASDIAKQLMKRMNIASDQTYLMAFFTHWMSRVLSTQSVMTSIKSRIFDQNFVHPVRHTAISARVSFHQEIFQILGDPEIKLLHAWLSKSKRDENYLANTILFYVGNCFKGVISEEVREQLVDFFHEWVLAETKDIIECIQLREKTGSLQVYAPESPGAYILLPDGTKQNLPCKTAEVIKRITNDKYHYFYYVKPIKMIAGNPHILLEYRTHQGHTSNLGAYIPFNYGTEILEGRPDEIELHFLKALWA